MSFSICNLKTGMVVELEDGSRGCIFLGVDGKDIISFHGTWTNLACYKHDLTYHQDNLGMDIMKVFLPSHYSQYGIINKEGSASLIWERKEYYEVKISYPFNIDDAKKVARYLSDIYGADCDIIKI